MFDVVNHTLVLFHGYIDRWFIIIASQDITTMHKANPTNKNHSQKNLQTKVLMLYISL